MNPFLHDLRLTLRTLRRAPTFAAVVVLTFALGIALNTVGFAVVRSVLWQPLAYPNAKRVTAIWEENLQRGFLRFGVSLQDFEDFRAQSRAFEALAAWWSGAGNLESEDQPRRVGYALVSPSLFSVLGTQAMLGRTPRADENDPGRDGVAVVSHALWRSALGARSDIVGTRIVLDGRPLDVVGVMPPGFRFPDGSVDVWKPFGVRPDDAGSRGARWVAAVGLLAPGTGVAAAQAGMRAIAERLAVSYPVNHGWTVRVEPLRETVVSDARAFLLILWGAAGVVLLIVCANVANLWLARGAARGRELAVRAALGASRGRLVRQLVTESVALALAGAALGVVGARLVLPVLAHWAPVSLPRLDELRVGGLAAAWSAVLALGAGIGFGALTALRAAADDTASLLRAGARAGTLVGARRLRGGLVVAEIALAVVVLAAAGVTFRSVANLLRVDPGFAATGRLTFRVAPTMVAFPERAAAVTFYDRLEERLAALPGVRRAAAVNVAPADGNWWSTSIFPEGAEPEPDRVPVANARVVAGDYFAAMGIPVVRGRTFARTDLAGGEAVAVIDETAARRYWPDGDPIGTRVRFSRDARAGWYRIVGVVGGVRHRALDLEPTPMIYRTLAQSEFGHFRDWAMTVVLETDGRPLALVPAVRAAVGEVAPTLPVYAIRSGDDLVAANLAERRAALALLAAFGGIAVLLAALGVYGVLALTVAARTREIGVRVALGAGRGAVAGLVVRQGLALSGLGIALGLAGAAGATRAVGSLLYDVSPTDPATYAVIAAVLLLVAAGACWIPARRALRVDPAVALTSE